MIRQDPGLLKDTYFYQALSGKWIVYIQHDRGDVEKHEFETEDDARSFYFKKIHI